MSCDFNDGNLCEYKQGSGEKFRWVVRADLDSAYNATVLGGSESPHQLFLDFTLLARKDIDYQIFKLDLADLFFLLMVSYLCVYDLRY